MAAKTPKVWLLSERATLAAWIEDPQRGQQLVDIHLDSDQWFQWLELPSSTSFKFEPADQRLSSFTACKETGTAGDGWYAYKKIGDELYNSYIGESKDLTLAKLRDIGLQMLKIGSNNSVSSKQNFKKEVRLTDSVQPLQIDQLKQEIQRLQDELATVRQTHLIACQEYKETIEQLRHQNQRLQTERDQLKEDINHLYARNGDLKLGRLVVQNS